MAAYPSTLPAPLIDGYGLSPFSQTIRTEMETGTPRVRRRSSVRNDTVRVSWLFTSSQMLLFRAWFDSPDYAAGGAAWFDLELYSGDGGSRVRECRFTNGWDANEVAKDTWRVTATLETRGGTLSADQIRGAMEGLVFGNIYPTLILDFVNDATIDSRITYTGGGGTYYDATGTLQTAGTNAARLDHDPATLARKGLLIEVSRQNLLLNSATLSTQSVTVTAVAHTLSFTGTGTVTLSGASTAGPLVGTGATDRVSLTFTPSAGSLTLTVSGTVTRGQLEIGSFPTSYISTAGTAVTRTVDKALLSGANFSSWWSGTEGTFVVEVTNTNTGTGGYPMLIYSGFVDERIILSLTASNEMNLQVLSGGTDTMGGYFPTVTAGTNTVAFAFKANDCDMYVDGAGSTADTSVTMPSGTMNAMAVGSSYTGGQSLNGWVRRILFYPVRMTAAQLAVLSALDA